MQRVGALAGLLLCAWSGGCAPECDHGTARACYCGGQPVGVQYCGGDGTWNPCASCKRPCYTRGERRACSSCFPGPTCAQYCEPLGGAGGPLTWSACASEERDAGTDAAPSTAAPYAACGASASCGPSAVCFRNSEFRFVCGGRCAADNECPRAPTGYEQLRPLCDRSQSAPVCVLTCVIGQRCPYGLSCVRLPTDGRYDYCG